MKFLRALSLSKQRNAGQCLTKPCADIGRRIVTECVVSFALPPSVLPLDQIWLSDESHETKPTKSHSTSQSPIRKRNTKLNSEAFIRGLACLISKITRLFSVSCRIVPSSLEVHFQTSIFKSQKIGFKRRIMHGFILDRKIPHVSVLISCGCPLNTVQDLWPMNLCNWPHAAKRMA